MRQHQLAECESRCNLPEISAKSARMTANHGCAMSQSLDGAFALSRSLFGGRANASYDLFFFCRSRSQALHIRMTYLFPLRRDTSSRVFSGVNGCPALQWVWRLRLAACL
jgi:hypothetical protein